MPSVPQVVLLLLGLHLGAFVAYAWDKRCARLGRWRLSERALLLWTLLGALGALAAIATIHHKNRKLRFLLPALLAAAAGLAAQGWLLASLATAP